MPAPWYSIRTRAAAQAAADAPKSAEVYIFGDIGESWLADTITAKQFVKDLGELDAEEITVRINSYGGSVTDGIAIYNALKRHPANVTVSIEAAAYSIASLIAMAGDTVEMADNALLMIHAPWSVAVGNSTDLRETADTLDKYAQAMASPYVAKSGMDQDAVLALLTDGKDHYYSADEALAAGFIDRVVAGLPAAASALIRTQAAQRYPSAGIRQALLAKATTQQGQQAAAAADQGTPASTTPAAAQSTPPEQTMTQPAPAAPAATLTPADVLAADKARRAAVRAEFAPFAAKNIAGLAELQQACEDDHDVTAAAAAQKILALIAKDVAPVGATHIETVEDEGDKRKAAVAAALMVRAGLADHNSEAGRQMLAAAQASPFRATSLLDLARASLDRAGIKHAMMDKRQVVASAFTQGTSDFPVLLEAAMHKTLQAAYAVQANTWSRFCAQGSVSDFRAHNRYRVGSFSNLDALNELGEFVNKSIPDGEKASIKAGTKGNIINLSRQAIIDDDLGAFIGLAASLARAAARTVEADVYALLALNSGLGPVMADSKTLFHADHKNIGTGAVLSVASLDADAVLLASQTDVSGNDFLDLSPAVLLVPKSLESSAKVINAAPYDPDTANKLQRPNPVSGLYRDIVGTPRLTGTRRYSFADPTVAPTLEVSFLDGNSTPFLEMDQGFTVDGSRYKVRLDYGVAAVDYRGAVTNAGQ